MSGAAPESSRPLTVLTGPNSGIVRRLAAALRHGGADVVLICPAGAAEAAAAVQQHSPAGPDAGSVTGIDADAEDRQALEAALADATSARRASVIVLHFEPDALHHRTFAELGHDGWARLCEAPIRRALLALQAAHTTLTAKGDGGGSIVVVTPTISMVGAAGYVALCGSAGAQRIMAETAARSWGGHGVTVNVVSVPVPSFADRWPEAGEPMADPTMALAEAALPPATWMTEAAATIAYLTSPAARAVTGATICIDGGVVMA